jgi:uncharacterized membrane protein
MLWWCTPNMEWYNDAAEAERPPPPAVVAAMATITTEEAEAAAEGRDAWRPHGDPSKAMTEREEAMNEFLEKLFASDRLIRIGFMFGTIPHSPFTAHA